MKRLTRTLPLILAAALQLMPLWRNIVASPAAGSTFAIILRWGIGAGAALGAVDAVSGATSVFTSPNSFNGTVGTYFSNSIVVSIGGGNSASSSDYFFLTSGAVASTTLANNQSTTSTLPPGLAFTASWVNNRSTIGGYVSGTPTVAGTNSTTVTCVSPGNASLSQTITFYISGSTTPTAPSITASPAAANVNAGNNASFAVVAAGSTPLYFQWLKNGVPLANGGNLSGATTATLTVASVSPADAGNYSVLASNAVGSATSAAAALTVIVPPVITSQPVAQTGAAAGSAVFSVTATGTAPLSYQWLKNGAAIANGTKFSGATTTTLTVSSIAAADAGNYSITVTNPAGSVTSSGAALTVVTSPAITTPPTSLSVAAGNAASFAVTAAGSTPLYFQWLKNSAPLANGGNLSGATTATLNISSTTTSDAGAYSVIVSNALGTATSASATLAVAVPPAIVNPPTDATVVAGNNVSFTITASGTAPLNYQWRKNGSAISGATTAALTLANVAAADAATYSVTVTNAVGSVTSASATLTVLLPPAITTPPTNTSIVLGSPTSFTATASGTLPLNFQWLKNGAAIPGATSNVLTLSATTTNDSGSYAVVVTNTVGSVASSSAALTVLVPPAIVNPPADATIVAGNTVSFSVTASGTAPLNYQWRKNGTPISGATTATLTLANVATADAATYSVVIGNSAGSATSTDAVLTVQSPPAILTQPANQNTVLGNSVALTVAATGTAPLNYQWIKGGVAIVDGGNLSGSATSTLTISALTTNEVDVYFVVISNFLGTATSASASISVNVAPIITLPPASQTIAVSNTVTFAAAATGTGPLAWHWRKNGTNLANSATVSGATSATLTLANVATNSSGNYSVVVTNLFGSTTSPAATLAVMIPPRITSSPTNRVAKTGTNATFSVAATGSAPLSYLWYKNGAPLTNGGNISGATTNVLKISSLTAADAGNYTVTVGNAVGSVTSIAASLTILVPPGILTQPVNQSVTVSNPITFTVTATGTAPLHCQWRKGPISIAGATNFSFTIPSAKTTDATNYSAVITNLAGSITSTSATLTVWVPPALVSQPTNRVAKVGTNTIFRATVSGTKPLNYQWFKNGTALVDGGSISGSLSNVLTVLVQNTNDGGAYSLTANNPAGSATSSNALLTVLVPPVIITQPASQSATAGHAATFSVTTAGTPPLHYQWRKGAVAIAGATNYTFSITGVKTNDAAAYSVVVTNLAGNVTSSNATLMVWVPPVFTLQAANRTATNGTTTLFRAAVAGVAPIKFQWFKNGAALNDGGNVTGSLSNVLTIVNLTTNNSGAYALAASNAGGTVTSSNAMLKVIVPAGRSGSGESDHGNIGSRPSRTTALANQQPNVSVQTGAIVSLPPTLQINSRANSGFTLTCLGQAGASYIFQAAGTLGADAAWTSLGTNAADASGVCRMVDTPTADCRFYRVQLAP